MNIQDSIDYNEINPAVLSILKGEHVHHFAVGLLEGQKMKELKAVVPSFLTVIKGSINFHIDSKTYTFNTLDTFEIPVHELHEVEGVEDKNIFTILQQK